MPYWSISCLYCLGEIVDALLECLPAEKKAGEAYQWLFSQRPGAVLACPYCSGLIGFDEAGQPRVPPSGWPVFRYSQAELELKKQSDGEPPQVSLADWALRHRFVRPGLQSPLVDYHYAEDAPPDEIVP